MSDTPVGDDSWQASDGKWYPGDQHPAHPAPTAAPAQTAAGGVGLPQGVAIANPWTRLGSYLLEGLLLLVTLFIGWVIWASMTARTGQTLANGFSAFALPMRRP